MLNLSDETMKALLVDGNMLAHRCHKGMPDLCNSSGIPTNMEFGMLRSLEILQKKYKDYTLVLCWDAPGSRNQRRKIADYYKESRQPSKERSQLYARLDVLKDKVLRHLYFNAEGKGLEADDILFAISKSCPIAKIYTNDKDLLQAVKGNSITVLKSHENRVFEWTEEKVFEKFRVKPFQLPLLRAVLGDKSDNIPGCRALGKAETSDYVREAYRRIAPGYEDIIGIFVDVVASYSRRYSAKKWEQWEDHVNRFLRPNYAVSLLTEDIEYRVIHPIEDTDSVANMLSYWEIRSLEISRKLIAKEFTEEEF